MLETMTPERGARLLMAAMRNVRMRQLGDLPGHEFHGNQHTTAAESHERAASLHDINSSEAQVASAAALKVTNASLHKTNRTDLTYHIEARRAADLASKGLHKEAAIAHREAARYHRNKAAGLKPWSKNYEMGPRVLGDVAGHEFHGNQWTSGGSGAGAKFGGAPVAGSKQWIKARQKDYESDPEFRAVADAASLLAQGNTWAIMRGSRAAAGDPVKDEKGVRNPLKEKLGAIASPMSNHKTYFEGQGKDWGKGTQGDFKNDVTVLEAGRLLNKAVDEGPKLEIPMYRGLHISPYDNSGRIEFTSGPKANKVYEKLANLKAGDSFHVSGVQSFTTEKQIAQDFSLGTARGQNSYESNRREQSNYGSSRRQQASVLIEIEKGARGLPIASLSPWKQREVLTRGKFEVVSNTKTPYGGQYSDKHDLYIVVRQRGK